MQLISPILCLCNYGQVRSVTMARLLEKKGYQTLAVGMLNNSTDTLDRLCSAAKTVIVVNKTNVDRRFRKDTSDSHAQMILEVLDKHKDKTYICDTVGFDRWGVPMHPELVERCELFLESPPNKEQLLEEIKSKYKKGE